MERGELIGEVVGSDRFGNLVTSVTLERLTELDSALAVSVVVAGREIGGLVRSYSQGPEGVPAAIIGSSDRLEVFVRNGDARAACGAHRGTPVRVAMARSGAAR